jgi:hypothetical protein
MAANQDFGGGGFFRVLAIACLIWALRECWRADGRASSGVHRHREGHPHPAAHPHPLGVRGAYAQLFTGLG